MKLAELDRVFKTLLSMEELRKLRICGLAVKAWERERREQYAQKRDEKGERVGSDPLSELTWWAMGKTQHVPGLVVNYGPPLDTPLSKLEEWMMLHHCPWYPGDPVVMHEAKLEKLKRQLSDDEVPF